MDVILFLLNAVMKLTVALTRFLVATVIWILDKLTNRIRTRTQPKPVLQEPYPVTPPPVPAVKRRNTPTAPEIHVHVATPLQPQPAPVSRPAQGAASSAPLAILSRPDHRIYITTGSHLMMEHPQAERLLESLDNMLYLAAHRDGKPFHFTPLDDGRVEYAAALQMPPVSAESEADFFNSSRQPLPTPDGALWVCRAGRQAEPVASK